MNTEVTCFDTNSAIFADNNNYNTEKLNEGCVKYVKGCLKDVKCSDDYKFICEKRWLL